jgi:hypothetical protein
MLCHVWELIPVSFNARNWREISLIYFRLSSHLLSFWFYLSPWKIGPNPLWIMLIHIILVSEHKKSCTWSRFTLNRRSELNYCSGHMICFLLVRVCHYNSFDVARTQTVSSLRRESFRNTVCAQFLLWSYAVLNLRHCLPFSELLLHKVSVPFSAERPVFS